MSDSGRFVLLYGSSRCGHACVAWANEVCIPIESTVEGCEGVRVNSAYRDFADLTQRRGTPILKFSPLTLLYSFQIHSRQTTY